MWELALVLAASALGCVAIAYFLRLAPQADGAALAPAEPLRDDLVLAGATAACAFVLAALRGTAHPFDRGSLRLGGFLAASVVAGAVVTAIARELRRRFPPSASDVPLARFAPAALFHPLASSLLLGALVGIASGTSHALGDPAKLAPAILPLVVGFALGALIPALGKNDPRTESDGALALETCAAMTLGVHFFQRDGALVAPLALRASALSFVFAPPVLRALFAATTLAAAFAFRRPPNETDGRAFGRAFHVGVVLATIALAGTSFALLGPLALPSLFAGAAGAAATMAAWALAGRREGGGILAVGASLLATAVAAMIAIKLLSLTDARHGALFGVAYAALGARGAAGLLDVVARTGDEEARATLEDVERSRARAARLPAEAIGILLVPLAVGAAAAAAACGRWAVTSALPTTDGAELFTQCELAGAAGSSATILDPAPLAAALLGVGLTALRPPVKLGSRIAGMLVAAAGLAVAAILGHVMGGGAQSALAACALAAGITAIVARSSEGPRRAIGASGALLGAMALAFAPMLG
jgi:hypothetical protein